MSVDEAIKALKKICSSISLPEQVDDGNVLSHSKIRELFSIIEAELNKVKLNK